MFNPKRIIEIIRETTTQFRKGEAVTQSTRSGITTIDVYMMDHVSKAPAGLEMVDTWFFMTGVDKAKAESHREELIKLLEDWDGQPLEQGLSYISFGYSLGSQDLALMFMALGQVLGFWRIATPAIFMPENPTENDITKANDLAGSGFVMATGYTPEKTNA